jgi:hypothetical protein
MKRSFVMIHYVAISMLLMLSIVCVATNDEGVRSMKIASKVPISMMIAEIPSFGLDHPRLLRELDQSIREREIDYTWGWLQKAINSDILAGCNKGEFQFLSDLGDKNDDALVISWQKDDLHVTVVDGRFLVLSVSMTNEAIADVGTVFRKVVNYSYYADKDRVKVRVETLSADASSESWGRITVDRGNARGWFEAPVEWHMARDEVIFAFEKVLKPPVSKIVPRDVSHLVGGIPLNDSRSYLRFEKSNRNELAMEYFKKRRHERAVQKDIDNKMKGRFLRRDGDVPKVPIKTDIE